MKVSIMKQTLYKTCFPLRKPKAAEEQHYQSTCQLCFYVSVPMRAVARGIMFSSCPSSHPILVDAIPQERLEEISSNVAQTFFWTD